MNAPALCVAVPMLLGIVCGAGGGVTPRVAIAVTLVAWAGAAGMLWRGARIAFVITVCAGFFGTGAALAARAQRQAVQPALLQWYEQERPDGPAQLTGVLRADAAAGPTGVSLVIDVLTANGRPVDGGARVSIAGALAAPAAAAWRAGRTVTLAASLHAPVDYRDPGVPSDRARLARQGIVLLGSVKSAALVTVTARGTYLSEAAAALRAAARTATTSAVGRWSRSSAGVVTAILIGDRSALDAEDERRLQEAGTYHVIAISGGNIALLTALLLLIGRAVHMPARATAAASLLLLAFYGYAAGLAPSVMRATIAGVVYLAARASDHRGAALNAVAVAAAVAGTIAPLTVLDPGFVLSFGATFAIVIAASRLHATRLEPRKDRPRERWRRIRDSVVGAAAMLGAATICAELALAPVGARLFGRISLAGFLLNFAAIPLMSIIQVAGLVALAVSPLSSLLAGAGGWIAHAGTVALLRSAALVDVAPWLVIDLPPPSWPVIAAWYSGWTCAIFARDRRVRISGGIIAAAATTLMIATPPATRATRVPRPPGGWTRIVFIDVGQGDATLILPAAGDPLLVDAGGVPGSSFDLGRRVTLPAAWAFGISRLHALVVTHGDPDHIGGAPAVLRALAPHEVWDGIPVPPHEPLRRLRERADRRGTRWIERRTGDVVRIGEMTIRVLHPPPPMWERIRVRNDDSIVLEIRVGDVAIVLPGDITQAVEPEVTRAIDPAPTLIVKAPHHGSAGSSSQRFVDATHPSAVVFSAGQRNPFGHPAPAIVQRYRAAGATVFSTPEDGAIVIDTDGREAVAWTWGSRRREVIAPRQGAGH